MIGFFNDLIKPDTLLAFCVATFLYYNNPTHIPSPSQSILFALQFVLVFLVCKNIIL